MEIGPINHGRPVVEQPESKPKTDGAAEQADRPTDDLIISAEARERLKEERIREELGIDEDKPVIDSVDYTPEKLRLIRERIDSGFYERSGIIDRTGDKLVDEMLDNIKLVYQ